MQLRDFGLRAFLGAPPATVFAALTDPHALEIWLDEFAEVDLEAGRFDFWGRFAPDNERGSKRLLGHEQNRSIAFSWRIRDAETTVSIVIEPVENGTALTLIQRGLPHREGAEPFAPDFWRFSLDNLANYVEGRTLAPRFPIDARTTPDAFARVEIDAQPGKVFASLLEPDQLDRWVAQHAKVEPWVGGRYDFGWDHGPIKILELEPDKALAYSWTWADTGETVVRWELEGSGGKTRLTLVHSGFAKTQDSRGYQLGWQAFMVGLQRMHALGDAWRRIEWVPVS